VSVLASVAGSASDGLGTALQDGLWKAQVQVTTTVGDTTYWWDGEAWSELSDDDVMTAWLGAQFPEGLDVGAEEPARWVYDGLGAFTDGQEYTVRARAIDVCGTVGEDVDTFVFDTGAPTVAIDYISNETAPTAGGGVSDVRSPIGSVHYRILDGGATEVLGWTEAGFTPDAVDSKIGTYELVSAVALANGTYTLEVRAVDEAGNVGSSARLFTVNVTMSHTWHLKAGWNMISLPVVPEDTSVETIFSEICYYVIYEWDAATEEYVDVYSLEPGKGYMIQVLQDVDVEISGSPVTGSTMELSAGWNLVGAFYEDLAMGEVIIVSVDPADASGYPMDDTYTIMTEGDTVVAGKGYWAYLEEDCTVTVMAGA